MYKSINTQDSSGWKGLKVQNFLTLEVSIHMKKLHCEVCFHSANVQSVYKKHPREITNNNSRQQDHRIAS